MATNNRSYRYICLLIASLLAFEVLSGCSMLPSPRVSATADGCHVEQVVERQRRYLPAAEATAQVEDRDSKFT